ncbi:MAG TPA: alkaline phosphatase family protein [Candidatus Polarisedimenticolia bacterium]|nr:alkaline phosphatase family protein [Candidatus Polarisedimenticolia bacterium]
MSTGTHVAVPLLHEVLRVPGGTLRAAGSVRVRTKEGIDIEIPFSIEAQMDDAALSKFLGSPSRTGSPVEALGAAASSSVSAWSRSASAESIALLEGKGELERKVRGDLEPLGFASITLRLDRPRGAPDAIAAITARALRDRMADTKLKVAIIGLDAADWEIIDPLLEKGQLPNLAALKARGAWGNIKTMIPTLSPLLWTSIATGKPPDEHGILDFLVRDAGTGLAVPVSSRGRKVKALWNIFSDAGRSSAFIAWWATWPAEPVNGWMISDRVAYSLFGFVANDPERKGITYPESYFGEIRPSLVDDGAITLDEVRKFAVVSPAQFAALRKQVKDDPKTAYREPVNHLTKILASARSYQAIALDILKRGQPDLFSIYYQGIDEVCHRFAHYMPPRMEMATAEEFAAYHDTVFAYYRYQDRLIGEVLAKLSKDTVVIVVSDHGFQNGTSRPTREPPYIEGKPGLWHRRYGVLIAAGPPIRRGRLDTTELLDIAPTVLYLSGLPVAQDMQGRVLKEAISQEFLARFPPRALPSYEEVGRSLEQIRPVVAGSGADEEIVARLKSLGYVGGGAGAAGGAPAGAPEAGRSGTGGAGTGGAGAGGAQAGGAQAGGAPAGGEGGEALSTANLNEASLYLAKKDYARARALTAETLKASPDFVPAKLLAIKIEEEEKHYDRAIELARQVIARYGEEERQVYLILGRLYKDGGRTREGIELYRSLAREHPDMPEIFATLGSLELHDGQTQAAEKDLFEALRLNPAQPEPLTELHTIYRNTPRILTLEPIVRKGLEINSKSVVHLNWLGMIHEWKKELPQAESTFKKAMEYDPDYAATMSNLGALYGRSGRLDEAIEILQRAVAKDPDNLESWVNLGAAQGRKGHSREAIEALETARGKGVRTTTLYNALALAYLQNRQPDKAKEFLRESLALDPGQKDAQDLLKAVSRPS